MTGRHAALAALLLCCGAAEAHSFGRVYTLPVPVWMYLYGAAAALVVSFLVVGYFVTSRSAGLSQKRRDVTDRLALLTSRPVVETLRVLGVLVLALTIATGFAGNRNPYLNFSMTFFWIVFLLGFTYLTALIGDVYAAISPWRAAADWMKSTFRGRLRYPERAGYWPALLLYFAFIWLELFGQMRPQSLAISLSAYAALTLAMMWLFSADAWLRHGEFFGVFFRIVAKMAPLERRDGRLRLRQPFAGLLDEPMENLGLLLFVLFMLSSTAFDGLHGTLLWVRFFWQELYAGALQEWVGSNPIAAYPAMRKLFLAWQTLGLLLSPLVYLALYALFVWLAKLAVRSERPLRELLLRFGYTLVPIALVYNVTHYYTLLLTEGPQILRLLSDPFGWGWNLLGTARRIWNPALDAGTIWHVQVGLILFGHIVSVYLAHVEALRLFPGRGRAALSQLPMLALMVAFTTIGLWILSLPLQPGAPAPG